MLLNHWMERVNNTVTLFYWSKSVRLKKSEKSDTPKTFYKCVYVHVFLVEALLGKTFNTFAVLELLITSQDQRLPGNSF